jgi:DNA-binding SARP family transcriptional activator
MLNVGTAQRREHVAGVIWPDMTDAKAKDNLRHTLWVIRKALGNRDYLLTDDLSVSFNTTLDYWLEPCWTQDQGELPTSDQLVSLRRGIAARLLRRLDQGTFAAPAQDGVAANKW